MCGINDPSRSGEVVSTGEYLDERYNTPKGTHKRFDGSHGFENAGNGKANIVKLGSRTASKKLGRNAPTVGTPPKKTILTGS